MRVFGISMAVFLAACGNGSDDTVQDSGEVRDSNTPSPELGELPPVPENAGVAYVAHYISPKLVWTRTDGPKAVNGGSLDIEGEAHDMDLDPIRDRLVIVHDVKKKVAIYQLDRPQNAADSVDAPELLHSFSTDDTPLFTRIDPYHQRLYVFTTSVDSGKSALHIYDDSGATPEFISQMEVPTSAAWDIDPVRQLFFIYDPDSEGIDVFDMGEDSPQELAGSPIPLREWYPEENSWAFSARNLRVDPWSARVYAGRPQGTVSELMAFSFDAAIPDANSRYNDFADMSSVEKIDDSFDVSIPYEERHYLLEAHGALSDPEDGLVFLNARAWNGKASTDMVVSMNTNLEELGACEDQKNQWCWLRHYSDSEPSTYLMSEGSGCVDRTNNVLVNTTVDITDDEGAGQIMLYAYEANGQMTPMLRSNGSNPSAAVYPVDAVCH